MNDETEPALGRGVNCASGRIYWAKLRRERR
jgi:hypothetical protein